MGSLMVRDVMTRDVVAVRPDTPFGDIVDTLAENQISAVPVVDRGGLVVGVVSEADVLSKLRPAVRRHSSRWLPSGRDRLARAKASVGSARDVMSTNLVTALPDTWVVVAAQRMDRAGVRRLVVVDELGRIRGILSRHDLLKVLQRPGHLR
jgi:CBS domain-containing protein